jgi:proline iminopeptidase
MRRILFTLLLLNGFVVTAQELYIRTFGDSGKPAIIFLHGGPGSHSVNFELTTAARLADKGFFVIVYDRRGEGRSKAKDAAYTFERSFEDINAIRDAYHLGKVNLIGHSFGGVLGSLYTRKYPDNVNALILAAAPLQTQESLKNIIKRSRALYEAQNDTANLNALATIQKMDTTSLFYISACFRHAMQNGFYKARHPAEAAKGLYAVIKADTVHQPSQSLSVQAAMGFCSKEHFASIDIRSCLRDLVNGGMRVFGVYGKDDGLYPPDIADELTSIVGPGHVVYYDNCSHNVFIDQQELFLEVVSSWLH